MQYVKLQVWTRHVGKDDDGLPVYGYWIFDETFAIIEGRFLRSRPVSG